MMEGWFLFLIIHIFLDSIFFIKLWLYVIWKEYLGNQILSRIAQVAHMESRITNSKFSEVIPKVE